MGILRNQWMRVLPVLLLLVATACNMPRRGAEGAGPDYVFTAAARTVEAQLTQVSQPPPTGQPGAQATLPGGVATPAPGNGTIAPPAGGSPAAPTALAGGCDQATFVDDITYPDDTDVAPGATFVKTWRLKNSGTCTWEASYAVVFVNGDAMGAPPVTPLTRAVAPGEEVDLSVTMKAPDAAGSYRGEFMLRNATNQQFGIGQEGRPFWVQVEVVGGTGMAFDFLAQAEEAAWASGSGSAAGAIIDFGGADDDPNGTAKVLDAVALENGATSGKLLLTYPRREEEGWITGLFPEYTVQTGDHLRARLGFMAGSGGQCGQGQVRYRIYYQEGTALNLLQEWSKTCNNTLIPVDIDLSGLQGKRVQFALSVGADGPPTDDWAVWYSPRIEH